MSAAEGIAGLALSAVSVAALFTTCIQCFDIIVAGRDFGIDFELLVTQLDVQRLRFLLWGESVRLGPSDSPVDYNYGLDRPDVRPVVERILLCIKHLLTEASEFTARYDLNASKSKRESGMDSERGLRIFKDTYEKFKKDAQKNQHQKSIWKVTRWAIHDANTFEALITRLKGFVDALESVTQSLKGVLEHQQTRLREEIESVSDAESLRLLRDASASSVQRPKTVSSIIVSSAASQRLVTLNASVSDRALPSNIGSSSLAETYYTASTGGRFPDSQRGLMQQDGFQIAGNSVTSTDIPQNQRVVSARLPTTHKEANIPCKESLGNVGKKIAPIQSEDLDCVRQIINDKQKCTNSAEKLVLRRLSEFAKEPIPFVSLRPIGGSLRDLLASVEGPPDSPYEGGVFYIRIAIPANFPFEPPVCRFLTKIYHPNINSSGKICLEVLGPSWDPKHGRLEKLLLALCALLDDPCIHDPLVPEIAEVFVQDRLAYTQNAELYTRKYATGSKPTILGDLKDLLNEDKSDYPEYLSPGSSSTLASIAATSAQEQLRVYIDTNAKLITGM